MGDINATGTIYRDGGTAVTDYVFTLFFGKENCVQKKGREYCDAILTGAPKDYSMVPLSELGSYLENNNHLYRLPGKKLTGSVDAGEIDRLLLEKIEELTIYTVQQQKQIDELKTEISALRENATPARMQDTKPAGGFEGAG